MTLGFSFVIATCGRPDHLAETLEAITRGTRLPERVVVVDASGDAATREVVESYQNRLPVSYERGAEPSAAMQRNYGARRVTSPLTAFMDDDITLYPDACERICSVFEKDESGEIGGISARIEGVSHPAPKGLLWWYYRLQAGYSHPTYSACLFGPAINCFPTYLEQTDLIPADWLNSACVFYRTPIFLDEMFPNFQGYSFMEDVHLSSRIARTRKLFFHSRALCVHRDGGGSSGRNGRNLARMRIRNQRLVARDVLNLRDPALALKLILHRLFASIYILRSRHQGWVDEMIGTWSA